MIWQEILRFLDTPMQTPQPYGWFHILSCVLTVVGAVLLCRFAKNPSKVVFVTAVLVTVAEIYKQINFSFSYANGVAFDFQWYAFPFQFCSTPMYVGLLTGLFRKGKVHESLCAYLASYALFAGLGVMAYPVTVFVPTIGINIQTMLCHGSMISVGVYLLYCGLKAELKTVWKALPVFCVAVLLAMSMNELAHITGLLQRETFNMFFISPYCEPSLPVYSLVQGVVPFPWCLLIYILGFTVAAYLMVLPFLIRKKVAV